MAALTTDQVLALRDAYRTAGISLEGLKASNPFDDDADLQGAYRLEQILRVNPQLYAELRTAANKDPAPSLELAAALAHQERGGAGPAEWSPALQQEWHSLNPVAAAEAQAAQEQALLESWSRLAEESAQRRKQPPTPDPARQEALAASKMRSTAQARQMAAAQGINPATGERIR